MRYKTPIREVGLNESDLVQGKEDTSIMFDWFGKHSEYLLISLVCLSILLTTPSISQAELTVDANCDSGNIGAYIITGNTLSFILNTDGLNYTYWTNFKVSGVLNQEVTFQITNANDVTFLSEPGRESQMVYSYDGENWNRLTNHSYSSGTYTITQTFTQSQVQIATFFPFSYEKMDAYVDDVSSTSPWVTKTVLGQSKQGRDIDLLTITNTNIPTGDKKIIYIVGRQHAAETASSHMLEGMIDFLMENDIWAKGFRDNYVWYIVPMVNPDGVYLGNSRADSTGIDLNRDWGNNDSVEINIVRAHIQSVDTTDSIDMFIDSHSQMNDDRWYNFIYSPTGNSFFSTLSEWTDFDSQSASGASSCTSSSCSCRGYIMNNILFDPTFVLEPTPHLVTWTEQSLNEQGRLFAFAINDYFGLFPPSVVLLDDGFESNPFDVHWNDNGTTEWIRNTSITHSSNASARAANGSEGDITTDDLDMSDASQIKVDFWFRNSSTELGDCKLYYYNGTEYIEIADFYNLGGQAVWSHYRETITDSQYFVSNFKLRVNASLGSSEYFRLDDVVISRVEVDSCSAANLDGLNSVNLLDFARLASDWFESGVALSGDINADEDVNLMDLEIQAFHWLSDCSPE